MEKQFTLISIDSKTVTYDLGDGAMPAESSFYAKGYGDFIAIEHHTSKNFGIVQVLVSAVTVNDATFDNDVDAVTAINALDVWVRPGTGSDGSGDITTTPIVFTEAEPDPETGEYALPATGDTIPTVFGKTLAWLNRLGRFAFAQIIAWSDISNRPTIPDVPSWALQNTKPTYTADEVGAATPENVDTAKTAANAYTDDKLTDYLTEEETYDAIEERIRGELTDKGDVETRDDLPTTADDFDLYYIASEDIDVYARNIAGALEWKTLNFTVDLSLYETTAGATEKANTAVGTANAYTDEAVADKQDKFTSVTDIVLVSELPADAADHPTIMYLIPE